MTAELEYIVGFNSCNRDLEFSNQAALNAFLDVATHHGMIAGEDITKLDTRWLLTGYHVKFFSRPKYGRKIKIRTWGRLIKGVLSSREFEILDENDNVVCIAISNWAYVNIKEKRLVRIPQELADSYECEPNRHNFDDEKIEKLSEPENLTFVKMFKADRDVLDSNMHVNKGKYLALADTVIPEELYMEKEPDEFIINYKKQIMYKEESECWFADDETSYTVVFKNNESINAIIKYIK